MYVLGIETSCDETAAAVAGPTGVLADIVHTQTIHAEFGGVVPELASRAHVEKLGPTVRAALAAAGIERPDAVAATAGPGLIGALLVGLSFGKALAAGWNVPFLGVNHLEAHMLAPLLETPAPRFPFLALIVSGGHCAVYECRALGDYALLGATIDDAAGEAYDKVARMLSLGYPGGPLVDALAAKGDPRAVELPRPKPGSLDFSFSGLKTAVRTAWARSPRPSPEDLCASFQAAVVDVLLDRVLRASRETGLKQVAITGGVAANSSLRARASALTDLQVFLPPRSRCTDNGAMIANLGRLHLVAGRRDPLDLAARPSWSPA